MRADDEPDAGQRSRRGNLQRLWPVVAVVIGTLLVIGLLQDSLLHYPERLTPSQALAAAKPAGLAAWPATDDLRGWLREAPNAHGTIVLFHGNGGHALHRAWFAEAMAELGWRTVLAEYPGYGHRDGSFDEARLADDAAATVGIARERHPGALVVAGESLGAGVAASALARSSTPIDGVLLITPWDTLAHIAGHHYPWLPVRLLLRDRYDTVANLRNIRVPKVVVVAERDSIIPASLGRGLYDALAEPRRLLVMPQAEHNDWMDRMTTGQWRDLLDFFTHEQKD